MKRNNEKDMDYSNGDSKGVGVDRGCRGRGVCMVGPVGDSEVYRPYTPQELVRAIGEHGQLVYAQVKYVGVRTEVLDSSWDKRNMNDILKAQACWLLTLGYRWLDDYSICGVRI